MDQLFRWYQADTEETVAFTLAFLGVYLVLSSLEMLVRHRSLQDGLLSWRISKFRRRLLVSSWLAPSLDLVLDYPSFLVVLIARILSGVGLVGGIFTPRDFVLTAIFVLLATSTSLLVSLRHAFGEDGADQLALISLVSFMIVLPWGEMGLGFALTFIAFQCLLAYTTAGISKLVSKSWRDGSGLLGVIRTKTYGTPWLFRILSLNGVAVLASWTVILGQLLVLPLFLVGGNALFITLCFAGMFHFLAAFVMRLHTFVWSFLSTYPAIIWLHRMLDQFIS